MIKSSIKEKRLSALYNYSNCTTSSKQKQLLSFILAIVNDRQIKEIVEYFNIKVK